MSRPARPIALDGLVARPTRTGVRVDVRVAPRASRPGIEGVREGRLLVRVSAAPVDNAANDAVVRVLADALDLPARAVRIVGGETSRRKTVEIEGLLESDVRQRLTAS